MESRGVVRNASSGVKVRLSRTQIDELTAHLEGTCESLEWGLSGIGIETDDALSFLDSDTLVEIDAAIFQCDTCGWWYGADEEAESDDEQLCEQCADDREGE